MNDCTVWARDAFSFWAPLDQQFLNALSNSSYWKQTLFFSPFWTKYFYAYLDYNQVSGETSQQIHTQLDEAALAAMNNNQFKPVHQQCAGLITRRPATRRRRIFRYTRRPLARARRAAEVPPLQLTRLTWAIPAR